MEPVASPPSPVVGTSSSSSASKQNANVQRTKPDLQLGRKGFHASIGFIVIALYLSPFHQMYISLALAFGSIFVLMLEVARLKNPSINRKFLSKLGFMLKPEEFETKIHASVYFLWGASGSLLIFPSREIAALSVLLLSFCDPVASIAGRLYGLQLGVMWPNRKSLAGSLAAAACGTLVTYIFLRFISFGYTCPTSSSSSSLPSFLHSAFDSSFSCLPLISLTAGLIAAVSEYPSIKWADDNLTLPLLSGVLLTLCSYAFGWNL